MRIVFFGSSEFGIPALKALHGQGTEIPLVVTTREKPKGRGLNLQPSPIKTCAQGLGLTVAEPDNPNIPEFAAELAKLAPDLIVLAAYRFILKPELLAVPAKGCLNLHPSLLPRYRGAAPIQRAIMNGEAETGLSVFLMNERLDQGDVILQVRVRIDPDETFGELAERLALAGADAVTRTVFQAMEANYERIPQDASQAGYAPKITKEERVIDWNRPAAGIHNQIRALAPEPGAYTVFRGRRLEILGSHVSDRLGQKPGELMVDAKTLLVGTSDRTLELRRLKPEGRRPVPASDFINGHRPRTGEHLGAAA